MKEDHQLASNKFWQKFWRFRSGKELLTTSGNIVGWGKEYLEDLLNPSDTPSVEEAEAEDSEVDSSIT